MTKPFRTLCQLLSAAATVSLFAAPLDADSQTDAYQAASQIDSKHIERPEEPDDPYVPNPSAVQPESNGLRQTFSRGPYVSVQVNTSLSGANLNGDAANEPSIAINPLNANEIVIGWRQFDSVASNFRQAGWAYSHDHGATWTFPGRIEAGLFRSDPVLNVSPEGVFYYYSLRTDAGFVCDMFRSIDGGVTWGPRIPAFGGDKAWMTVDHTNGLGRGNIYISWSPVAACCGSNVFTRSTDGGFSYLTPIAIPFTPIHGQLAVGPDGALYIAGRASASGAPVIKSSNAQDPLATPVFETVRTVFLGGSTSSGGVNPAGLLGQMSIAVDHSGGPTHGNVYILGSVNPRGPDPLDVMFARSTDGGLNWDPPIRVNDDSLSTNAVQWFGTMSVAPNGRIDVIFNDTRAVSDASRSELYYATSMDGGVSFTPNIPVSPSFDQSLGYPNQSKLGDYYDMVSDNIGVGIAYAATFNGEQDVYYLRINPFDCNQNGVDDSDDIALGTSLDCNKNMFPDECEDDCNTTGVPDDCDVANQTSEDCNNNNFPDECETDCNASGVPDDCDLLNMTSDDCNLNAVPDECDLVGNDCDVNLVPDECQLAELVATLTSPADQSVCPDGDASFSVVSPLSGLTYQWMRNGTPLVEGVDGNGTQTANLLITNADASDVGFYSCMVSTGCISTESDLASMTLFEPVSIAQQPATLSQTCTGNTLILAVETIGDNPTFQWQRNGTPLVEQPGAFENVNTSQLSIVNISAFEIDDYNCVVTDDCGGLEESESGTFAIGDASFIVQPTPTCAVMGDNVSLTAIADAGGLSIFQQWHKDGVPLVDGGDISGAFTDTLFIEDITAANEGGYALRALSLGPNCSEFSDTVTVLLDTCVCESPGDFDMDDDVDLQDFQQFQACFGQNVAYNNACSCANIDDLDDMINLDDWSSYAPIATGP
ncbi:MAG: hypothetical protein DHS20C16_24960 [Phycisphaerae bacterium]|nr:MAG: hypothetical protein DHS20C16_24960 [Phycisphaerae bacterium]